MDGSTQADDLLLLRRFALDADHEAFRQIVTRYTGMVFATSRRVLGDRTRAEEVVQETFHLLLRKPGSVRCSLAGWLHRAATNLALDVVRSDAARQQREAGYVRPDNAPDPAWREASACIDQCLEDLPDDLRELLVRHFLLDQEQKDLARERGVSPATISRRIDAGVELLRRKLHARGFGVAAGAVLAALGLYRGEPVSAATTSELGKMALHGPGHAAAVPAVAGSRAGALVAVGAVGLVTVIVGIILLTPGGAARIGGGPGAPAPPPPTVRSRITEVPAPAPVPPAPVPAAAPTESSAGAAPDEAPEARIVVLPGAPDDLDPRHVAAFQMPGPGAGGMASVGFRDGHVVTLPVAELRRLVQEQTGQTPEYWVQQGPGAGTP